jgi:hypothetical protein
MNMKELEGLMKGADVEYIGLHSHLSFGGTKETISGDFACE